MSTPNAIEYEMTHATGSGVLPVSSVPTYLRRDPGPRNAPTAAAPMFEAGPTTRAAIWMSRRGNRWGFPLALASALAYAGAAWFFYELHHMVVWVFVVLFAYNALKFTLVAGWLILLGVGGLLRAAIGRPVR